MLKIGITCRITEASNYLESRNSLAIDWMTYFNKIDIIPILIPHGIDDISKYIKNTKLDGIILSGGNNINPELYSSSVKLNSVYELRDLNEYEIIRYCIDSDLPLLGICRGMSIINIFFGGSLTHNVKNHTNTNHYVSINKFNNYLSSEKNVNSYHDHAIKLEDLASNMNYFAITEDQYVEGIYNSERTIFGVQWHPERAPYDPEMTSFIYEIMRKKVL